MALCRGCCVQLLIPPIPHTFSHSVLVPHCLQFSKKRKKKGGICPKYRIFICFWWLVWFRNLQLRWHGGICKETWQEYKEEEQQQEEGTFQQEIFQKKKKTISSWSSHWFLSFFFCVNARVHVHPEKLIKMCFSCFLYGDSQTYYIYIYIY